MTRKVRPVRADAQDVRPWPSSVSTTTLFGVCDDCGGRSQTLSGAAAIVTARTDGSGAVS